MRELDIQKEIMHWLKIMRIFHWRHHNAPKKIHKNLMMRGISDIIAVVNGQIVCIEVKTKNGKQSEDQKIFESNITGNGGIYMLVRSLDDFMRQWKEYIAYN